MKYKALAGTIFISFSFLLTAEPSLSGYMKNDLELQKLALEVKKAALKDKKTEIENGLDLSLSTGTATFRFSGDDSEISFKPSAEISIPQLSNINLSASSNISIENGSNKSSDINLSLGIDLVSGAALARKINLLKSNRALLEAKRNLQEKALEVEKEYYTELKALFSKASEVSSLKKDLYEDTISFDEIKAKGYTKTSAKYRQAEMKVLADQHEVETTRHELEHNCAVFASKCGTSYESGTDVAEFLPETIPEVPEVNILDFDKKDYKKIEQAEYDHQLAELERKADKDFSLKANAGYTFRNSNTSFSSTGTKSDTIDTGLTATYQGLSLGAGVYIPTDGTKPVYSASAGIKPNTFRTAQIKRKTNECNEEEELIAIKSAEDSYETDVVDKQSELNDIKWSKETYGKTFEMYQTLEKDMKALYSQGLIKETEYLDAFANRELYQYKIIMNKIDFIIYNNSTKLLFCQDSELKD